MVNKERLVELLGEGYYINGDEDVCDKKDVIWFDEDLQKASNKIHLMGYLDNRLAISQYDYIYSKLDDSIFEVDKEKVKSNLGKLGLRGYFGVDRSYYLEHVSGCINERYFNYVQNLELIPDEERKSRAECFYNDILKASKEWGK